MKGLGFIFCNLEINLFNCVQSVTSNVVIKYGRPTISRFTYIKDRFFKKYYLSPENLMATSFVVSSFPGEFQDQDSKARL